MGDAMSLLVFVLEMVASIVLWEQAKRLACWARSVKPRRWYGADVLVLEFGRDVDLLTQQGLIEWRGGPSVVAKRWGSGRDVRYARTDVPGREGRITRKIHWFDRVPTPTGRAVADAALAGAARAAGAPGFARSFHDRTLSDEPAERGR